MKPFEIPLKSLTSQFIIVIHLSCEIELNRHEKKKNWDLLWLRKQQTQCIAVLLPRVYTIQTRSVLILLLLLLMFYTFYISWQHKGSASLTFHCI